MKILKLHSWHPAPSDAIEIQRNLKKRIRLQFPAKKISIIAGADASFKHGKAVGAVAVLSFPELEVLEAVVKSRPLTYPYISGLLTFREGPVLLDCFKALKHEPDVIIFDGQGIAHFRNMGIATHLGIILSKPSIGCAKSRLTGRIRPLGITKGSYSYITDKHNRILGAAVRTREGVKPVFVSPGHKITLSKSIEIILKTSKKFRLTEPIRLAHHLTQANNPRR
jgi:deoxyribonuclease V